MPRRILLIRFICVLHRWTVERAISTFNAGAVARPPALRGRQGSERHCCCKTTTVATSPQKPAKAIHRPRAARLPVTSISHVDSSGVKPPNKAVASA
jgi:hypothetical protein